MLARSVFTEQRSQFSCRVASIGPGFLRLLLISCPSHSPFAGAVQTGTPVTQDNENHGPRRGLTLSMPLLKRSVQSRLASVVMARVLSCAVPSTTLEAGSYHAQQWLSLSVVWRRDVDCEAAAAISEPARLGRSFPCPAPSSLFFK